jgi:hypothetical protein
MNVLQLLTGRLPTSAIRINDPFPERLNGSTSLFNRAETLSSYRVHVSTSRLPAVQMDSKKK